MSDSMLASGSQLGPFEILDALGTGGMGKVEPLCGRAPFDDAQGKLRGSPQANSRRRAERGGGIPC